MGQKDTDVQTRDCASLKNSREWQESQRLTAFRQHFYSEMRRLYA